MFQILIKDIDGKLLTKDSLIKMVEGDTEEPYGETSPVRMVLTEDGMFEIRAFESNFSYKRIYDGSYAPLFKIVN